MKKRSVLLFFYYFFYILQVYLKRSVLEKILALKIGKLNYSSLFPHSHPVRGREGGGRWGLFCALPLSPHRPTPPHPGTNSDLLHLGAFSPFPLQVLKLVNSLAGKWTLSQSHTLAPTP